MNNYHFKIATEHFERDVFVKADTYNDALDTLFENNHFNNYEFQGIIQWCNVDG